MQSAFVSVADLSALSMEGMACIDLIRFQWSAGPPPEAAEIFLSLGSMDMALAEPAISDGGPPTFWSSCSGLIAALLQTSLGFCTDSGGEGECFAGFDVDAGGVNGVAGGQTKVEHVDEQLRGDGDDLGATRQP